MKTLRNLWTAGFQTLALALSLAPGLRAQEGFSASDYRQFRESHVDYPAASLLADHPQGAYYSHRTNPADLGSIAWLDSIDRVLGLTSDEKEMLARQHFMITERGAEMSWTNAFIRLYSSDLPLFLSTDFILSTLHNSYDNILQYIEWNYLEPNLHELLLAMYEHFPVIAGKYSGDERLTEVLEDVDLYITVALSLAEGKARSPRVVPPATFEQVMQAIASEQMTQMPLFTEEGLNRKLDFSQFTPRGHYNKQEYWMMGDDLSDYFRAMMWLGRIDFLMTAPPGNPWEPDWTEEQLRRMQLGALLTNELLYSCGKLENLQDHEEVITFLVGPDDNLTPAELKALEEEALENPADLFKGSNFDLFTQALNASDDHGQKIMSNFFFVDPDINEPSELPVSYKLLGQKFLLDSYVFHELVFDRITFEGKKVYRPLPDPLDAMAALGSNDALALVEEEMEEYKYAANMASLRYLIGSYEEGFWSQSLYNIWLSAIRSLNEAPDAEELPYFMQTSAWHHEKLNTQLASWSQLRHDNILYGKQSYTGGSGCSYPHTYVEPYPGLYSAIAEFSEQAEAFFTRVLPVGMEGRDRIISFYGSYGEIMERLTEAARKELSGEAFSEDELVFFKTMINEYMVSGPSISGWYNDFFFDLMKGHGLDFTVADVHTQPTDQNGSVVGNVLHVGNGMINMGVFLADNPCKPGQLMAFAGPVSSFHTEVRPGFERLTDQNWEERFWSGRENHPPRPDWVAAYLLDHEGKKRPGARQLKGSAYNGSSAGADPLGLDYLLLFPNPASDFCQLRFVLNKRARVDLRIFDTRGRQLMACDAGELYPAEHSLPIDVAALEPGAYYVQVRVGKNVFYRELIRSGY